LSRAGATADWICCQIGAREHYAVARMLHHAGRLERLCTDLWIPPGIPFLTDRWHPDLRPARIFAPNLRILAFELAQKLRGTGEWERIMARNEKFQELVLQNLQKNAPREATLFSYSYAAARLFAHAKERGWRTVLGQIDPGPEEERLVQEEHRRYPQYGSTRQSPPESYWTDWKRETELADRIVVNSNWSRECLLKEGVPEGKMKVVPLAYRALSDETREGKADRLSLSLSGSKPSAENYLNFNLNLKRRSPPSAISDLPSTNEALRVLFLGQVNLRKGVARLVEAMRMLRNEPIELTLAGPCSVDPAAWADLPNVRWTGPVPRGATGECYRQADVFMLPTISDGFALTQLEAMAHGLPVIATRRCGEVVTHGEDGWILEDAEPATVAHTLKEAMAVKEWTPMREAARRKAERFRLEEVGKLFLEAAE